MSYFMQRVGLLGVASVPLGFVYYTTADAGTQFSLTSMLGPVVRLTMDAETSHTFGVWSAKTGLMPTETRPDSPLLSTKVWGKTFRNPIGEYNLHLLPPPTFPQLLEIGYPRPNRRRRHDGQVHCMQRVNTVLANIANQV